MSKIQHVRLSWVVILVVVLALGIFQPHMARVAAQSPKTVTYDTPVEGQITDANPEDDWTLTAPAKDLIMVTVERSGGTLAPTVELRDANNQRVAGAETDNTYAKATINNFTLPANGTFGIAVSRYSGKDGKTSGNYKLTVALMGAGDDNPILKTQPKPIDYDKPSDGEITAGRWKESWAFNAPGK